jgi:outer membrane usher protein
VRFLYAKALNDLGTNFQLLGYRYSTEGFYTLDETTYKNMSGYTGDNEWKDEDHDGKQDKPVWTDYYDLYYTKKGKAQLNISQQVGKIGSIFVTGSEQTYWHTDEKDRMLQVGYNGSWNGISYSLTWNYDKSPGKTRRTRSTPLIFRCRLASGSPATIARISTVRPTPPI